MSNTFNNLFLIGRPAGGKSEFISFMKGVDDVRRAGRFHVGPFEEIDDFPWIYEKFREDDVWEAAGHKRLYSEQVGEKIYNTTDFALYDFMICKFNKEISERYLSPPSFYNDKTLFIEFSRGMKDAYKRAFSMFDKSVLEKAAILNIFVTFEESCRRNYARATEKCEQGILRHTVPKDVIEGYYRENDWREITSGRDDGYLELEGVPVPFVTMNNEPEMPAGPEIEDRYKNALDKLFELYCEG